MPVAEAAGQTSAALQSPWAACLKKVQTRNGSVTRKLPSLGPIPRPPPNPSFFRVALLGIRRPRCSVGAATLRAAVHPSPVTRPTGVRPGCARDPAKMEPGERADARSNHPTHAVLKRLSTQVCAIFLCSAHLRAMCFAFQVEQRFSFVSDIFPSLRTCLWGALHSFLCSELACICMLSSCNGFHEVLESSPATRAAQTPRVYTPPPGEGFAVFLQRRPCPGSAQMRATPVRRVIAVVSPTHRPPPDPQPADPSEKPRPLKSIRIRPSAQLRATDVTQKKS
jgi:hypothetical protein